MNLDKIRVLAILGDIHTAKTNLAIHFLRKYKGGRAIYLYGYPKQIDKFKSVSSLQELSQIDNSIVFFDELQKHIPFYQRKISDLFLELLSTMAHQNNTILFTTPMSQYITKSLDCFLDGFCYTKFSDLSTLKNGSKAKRKLIGFSNPQINNWTLNLQMGEYIEIIDSNKSDDNGLKTFPDQNIGKDWRNK